MLRHPRNELLPRPTSLRPPRLKPVDASINPSNDERRNNEREPEKDDDEAAEEPAVGVVGDDAVAGGEEGLRFV